MYNNILYNINKLFYQRFNLNLYANVMIDIFIDILRSFGNDINDSKCCHIIA